jgi:pilus assembly protein CpaE
MTNVLVIDDEEIFRGLVSKSLDGLDFKITVAENGNTGLQKAHSIKPDLIICDVMMPNVSGYDLVSSLRREPEFASTPILMLTAQVGLQDKLKAFEAGADDHLTKPFEPAELVARINVLLRRNETRNAQGTPVTTATRESGRTVVVHSLRGGAGCSSLAVNLALGNKGLWKGSTILLDLTMMAGQVALMLNTSLKRTWADIAHHLPGELDEHVVNSIISHHESGLDFIAAPTLPSDADLIKPESLGEALRLIQPQYDYIFIDLPHDFHDFTLQALDIADLIILVATPDMASVRASSAALDTYKKLGYSREKIRFVINATFPRLGLPHEKIGAALGMPVSMIIPYSPDLFVEAINAGKPIISNKPGDPISALLEDYAFNISKPTDKKNRPNPATEAWLRVYQRYKERQIGLK